MTQTGVSTPRDYCRAEATSNATQRLQLHEVWWEQGWAAHCQEGECEID